MFDLAAASLAAFPLLPPRRAVPLLSHVCFQSRPHFRFQCAKEPAEVAHSCSPGSSGGGLSDEYSSGSGIAV